MIEFGLSELVRSKLLAPSGLPCLSSGFAVEPLLARADHENLKIAFKKMTSKIQFYQQCFRQLFVSAVAVKAKLGAQHGYLGCLQGT